MKINIKIIILMISGLIGFSHVNAAEGDEVLGTWINQAGDGQIKISVQEGKYVGVILGSTDPDSPDRKDINNPDPALKDRSLTDLTILADLIYRGSNKWSGGWIYDPNNGKTYKCKMTLKDINTLDIRGYVGIPAFGRSEEWKRKIID